MQKPPQSRSVAPLSDRERYRNQARLLEEASHGLFQLLKKEGVTKAWLAKRLGVSPPRVTALLRGDSNLTLESVADAYLAFGRHVHITLGVDPEEMRFPHDEKLLLVGQEDATSTTAPAFRFGPVQPAASGPRLPSAARVSIGQGLGLVG